MSEATPGTSAEDDLALVETTLTESQPGRAARALGALRVAVKVLCGLAILSGLAALSLGLNAWSNAPLGLVWVVAVGGVTISAGTYVLVRINSLGAALTNPAEVLEQARDLVERAKGTAELARVATLVRGRTQGTAKPSGGRVRTAVRRGQMISAVIGIANPDPKRHSHLVAFTPTRLARLWTAIAIGLWAWAIALTTALVAFWVLVARVLS